MPNENTNNLVTALRCPSEYPSFGAISEIAGRLNVPVTSLSRGIRQLQDLAPRIALRRGRTAKQEGAGTHELSPGFMVADGQRVFNTFVSDA